jgi:transposase
MIDTNEVTKPLRGEVRSGIVRRRRWRAEEKGRIVAEAVAPDAVIAEVARRHDLTPQHLSNWIRAAKAGRLVLPAPDDGAEAETSGVEFVPVVTTQGRRTVPAGAASCIEILAGSMVVRVPLNANVQILEVILRAVKRA